jgi:uncharacterized membrane protein YgaE (UPF0421/DUF939 family)
MNMKFITGFFCGIVVCVILNIFIIQDYESGVKDKYKNYDNIIDSIKVNIDSVRNTNEHNNNNQLKINDSLLNVKQKIITKYEIIEKDFGDYNIVSDDSISSYISRKIKDRK